MLINKAFVYKLKPTKQHRQLFRQYAGAARWVWNHMLDERKSYYQHTGESLTYNAQFKRLTMLKQQPKTAWLRVIHSQVLQEPIKNLRQAFKNFFEGRANYPRFKSKKCVRQSFAYPQGVKVEGNRIYLPKIGWVRFYKSQDVEGTIKRATVTRKASGWYVSITCEVEIEPPNIKPNKDTVIGIDLGLNDFAVTSDGERIKAPQYLWKAERKLTRAQRRLSRKKRGSNRYRKQRRRVGRLHERVANARKDFLHKLSTRLVSENQGIIVEDLNVKSLARTHLAKSVHDAGWSKFVHQLEYKCLWAGKPFQTVGSFFPSTKLHGDCGTLNEISLTDRQFVCQGCGKLIDRDLNAALNIKGQGWKTMLAAGQTDSENAHGERVRLAIASCAR